MPGEPGGKLDAALGEKKRPAHAPQPGDGVEPDEAVPIVPLSVAHPRFVNEREPSAIKGYQLRAAPELVGLYRGDGLGDGLRLLVEHTRRITEVDESQIAADDLRHPVPGRLAIDHL